MREILLKMVFNGLLFTLVSTMLILITSAKSFNNKIVNGHDTDISDVPYQASVLREEYPLCSGVILNERTVISAGYDFEMFVTSF